MTLSIRIFPRYQCKTLSCWSSPFPTICPASISSARRLLINMFSSADDDTREMKKQVSLKPSVVSRAQWSLKS